MATLLESSKDKGFSWPQVAFLAEELKKGHHNVIKKEEKPVLTEEKAPVYSHIINHHLNEAGKWYEIKLEHDIVTWQLKARGDYELKYAFDPTHSTFMTLASGAVLTEDTVPNREIDALYVMCETADVVAELEIWRHGEKHAED